MLKVVLTGAPHSGKSTLSEELINTGKIVVPETAIQVIDSLNDLLGPKKASTWRSNNFESFQNLILSRQSYMEEQVTNYALDSMDLHDDVIFLDRGAFDSVAFSRHYNVNHEYDGEFDHIDASYDKAFVLELVLPFNTREDSGRIETEDDCLALQKHLVDIYTKLGLKPAMVPLMPVEDRVEFILDRIK